MSELLAIENLTAGYGDITVLRDITLSIAPGQVVALLGANGAGKTTLLRAVSGLVESAGAIRFDGRPLSGLPPESIAQRGVAHVPEGRGTFVHLTVDENLQLGAWLRRDRAGIAADRERMFQHFPRLKERLRQQAGTLSGGEQQMLAIARALMSSPKLLLVDEPSVGLSPLLVSTTVTMIDQLKKRHGLTVLMAEQNFHQAIRIADRGYLIVHGEIVFEGKTVADLENNDLVKNYYLGTA
jgi:branched-chain amino acid transport system ATP-binding protein